MPVFLVYSLSCFRNCFQLSMEFSKPFAGIVCFCRVTLAYKSVFASTLIVATIRMDCYPLSHEGCGVGFKSLKVSKLNGKGKHPIMGFPIN